MGIEGMAPDSVFLDSRAEVQYWCLQFDASEAQIRRAVMAVGTHPARVGAWLREMNRANALSPGAGSFVAATVRNLAFFFVGVGGATLIP